MLRRVFEEHVARCERKFGSNDERTAAAARDLGFFLRDSGDRKAAAAAFARALAIDEGKLGSEAPRVLAGMLALASVSPPQDAETLFRRALMSRGMNPALAVPALSALGELRLASGDRAGAAAAWRPALRHAEAVSGADSDTVAKILFSLSEATEPKESVALLERALGIAMRNFGEKHPETATCEVNLANALLRAGRKAEAARQAQIGLAAFEATLGPAHPRVAVALTTLARAQTDPKAAVALYRRAVEIDRRSLGDGAARTVADRRALSALAK